MNQGPSRRDFLRGRLFVGGRDRPDEHDPPAALNPSEPLSGDLPRGDQDQPYFLKVKRAAMAGEFEVRLNMGQYEGATEAALEALAGIDLLEERLSFFDPASEISRINREAANGPVAVDSDTFALLVQSQAIHESTDGAFDITATPLWEIWGFARREARVPDDQEIARAMRTVGGGLVRLDRQAETVEFLKPGVQINLGGIGKGYAIERCAESLKNAGVHDMLIHGAASSILARGTQAGRSKGWSVGVAHPIRQGRRIAEIQLDDQSLATSGGRHQSMVHSGRRLSHVIDPRTGRPAEGVYSVTVVTGDAAQADALATAMFVLGADASLAFCKRHPEVSVLLLLPSTTRSRELDVVYAGFAGGSLHVL